MSSRLDCGSVGNEAATKLGPSLVSVASAYSREAEQKPRPTHLWIPDMIKCQLGIRVAEKKLMKQK
jgi:hypothetical protein